MEDPIREDGVEFSRIGEVRAMRLKHVHFLQDVEGRAASLHYVRELRQEEKRGAVAVVRAADWLAGLAA